MPDQVHGTKLGRVALAAVIAGGSEPLMYSGASEKVSQKVVAPSASIPPQHWRSTKSACSALPIRPSAWSVKYVLKALSWQMLSGSEKACS